VGSVKKGILALLIVFLVAAVGVSDGASAGKLHKCKATQAGGWKAYQVRASHKVSCSAAGKVIRRWFNSDLQPAPVIVAGDKWSCGTDLGLTEGECSARRVGLVRFRLLLL
jgi:hypothetical protein